MIAPGEPRGSLARALRLSALGLLTLVVVVLTAGISLSSRGQEAMTRSDRAFDEGRVRDSVVAAREAALSYVPGSDHVRAAYERLEAVARGAEGNGDFELAKFAWDSLRVVCEETDYPGRIVPEQLGRARSGLRRVGEMP